MLSGDTFPAAVGSRLAAPGDMEQQPLSVPLFVEGCAGIWGPLLPSSESSSTGSSCAPQLPLGQQELCVEFNILKEITEGLPAWKSCLDLFPHLLWPQTLRKGMKEERRGRKPALLSKPGSKEVLTSILSLRALESSSLSPC